MSVAKKKFHTLKKVLVVAALYVCTVGILSAAFLLAPVDDNRFPILRIVIIIFASVLLTKYCLYMTISPWYDAVGAYTKKKWRTLRPHFEPKVSVLIPAWNEEVGVITTMRSVLMSAYQNIELVVVNDGSTDNSDTLIRSFIKQYEELPESVRGNKTITYMYKENGGKGRALNTALELSTGDILVSIDADCHVKENTIENFVECFRDPSVSAVVGNVKIGNTTTLIGLIQYMEFLFSFYFKKTESLLGVIYIVGGAAGAYRRHIFEELGPYNVTNITEDIELSMRIQDAGMKIVYAEDAVVYTEGASDVRGLMRQRLRWKRGRFETFRDYMHMFFSTSIQHKKVLTMLVLPLALFAELQLSLEMLFLTFLYVYSYLTSDYSSFVLGIIVVSSMFVIQLLFDSKDRNDWSFYILAPVAWLLFYVMTFVETNALFRSIWGYLRRQEVEWQRWKRAGVHS